MKALELTVYPVLERPSRGADIMAYRSQFIDESLLIQAKRFTDAELAAEVWRQEAQVTTVEAMGGTPVRNLAVLNTIHRFATLPHYDEVA